MKHLELLHNAGEIGSPITALVAFTAGILIHLSVVRNIYIEQYLRFTIVSFALLTPLSVYQYSVFSHLSLLNSAVRAAIVLASLFSGLSTSIVLYRAFFHPLRHFPGPFPARVSKLYGAWLAGKKVMYYKDLAEMHERYGDFVRTGPRELSIRRQSAVEVIYGPRSKCIKSAWYDQVSTKDTKSSIHMTRDATLHRLRRKVWDRAFTPKALDQYLPQIVSKVNALTDKLTSASAESTPLDATQWSLLLSFDIMGMVGLGRDFGGISTGSRHPAIRAIQEHMRMLSILSHVPWFLNLFSLVPGATAGYMPFFGFCAEQVNEKRERMLASSKKQSADDERSPPPDIMSWLIAAFEDPVDPAGVPSREALDEDSRVVIIAGSETTATTLTTALYYMAKLPAEQRKLQTALDRAIGDEWTYDKVKGCALLDHVIFETLRLQPALRTGASRETPPRGITVDEVYIPGGVNVIVGVQGIQTDPRYWGDGAGKFVPERWGEKGRRLGPYMPFSIGPYQCPGKTLAIMSLRISLSKIVQNFDIAFAPGEDGAKFESEALDVFTTSLPPCQLIFTKRVGG